MMMGLDTVIWIILLVALLSAAVATVFARSLFVATGLLALTSVFLAVALYFWGMKLAAVIELTVSAGLVTAVFASAIALLRPTAEAPHADTTGSAGAGSAGAESSSASPTGPSKMSRFARYLPLPIILLALAVAIFIFAPDIDLNTATVSLLDTAPQIMLWSKRAVDIVAIIFLILAGVLGVAMLIRRREEK